MINFKLYKDIALKKIDNQFNEKTLIKIITDVHSIKRIEKETKVKLKKMGLDPRWSQIGVVYQDQYLTIVRDAVVFPNGKEGTYIRTINKNPENHGVAILAVYCGKIVILEHYRHATQSFHYEIPRGFSDEKLTCLENAKRELHEEIGCVLDSIVSLGEMYTNTGISSEKVLLFFAKVSSIGQPDKEEGIKSIMLYSNNEMEALINNGKVNDSFTVNAYCLAKIKGLF